MRFPERVFHSLGNWASQISSLCCELRVQSASRDDPKSVSYTHLTLPTIYSV